LAGPLFFCVGATSIYILYFNKDSANVGPKVDLVTKQADPKANTSSEMMDNSLTAKSDFEVISAGFQLVKKGFKAIL
jgi:hypothetical protein